MNYIKFSHDYRKLQDRLFTTIRRRDDYPEVGEEVQVRAPSSSFAAVILWKILITLEEIPTSLLCHDTDTETRENALKLLNSFYRKPIQPFENLTLILLLKKEDKT